MIILVIESQKKLLPHDVRRRLGVPHLDEKFIVFGVGKVIGSFKKHNSLNQSELLKNGKGRAN
jgi:hypothetical protein